MKQTMRILTLLALALFSSGRIWAASVVSIDVTGGQLKFFSDEACTTSISEAEAGSTVYIKAIPDYGYTGNGATFAAVASVGSNQAESRRAVHVDETLPFGGAVEVRTVDNTRGIYSLTMPDDTGVAVSATLATVTSTTVSYVDEKYETHTVSAVPLDLTMTVLAADQWYFVGSDITFDQGFTSKNDEMMRNRCIVVADGATFTIGTKDAPLENDAFYFGGSLFLYGQEEATGKLSINSEKGGTDIGGCFVIANVDVDITSKSIALSGSSNGNGSFIAGHPTKGNTVTVRSSNGYGGISAAGKPLVIKNCNVDVDSKEGMGINTGGVSLTIEGLANGTSSVKIHSANNGINVGGATATIKYCDIDIVSDDGHGIYGGGSPVIIEGVDKGTNNVKVRSKGNGIYGGGYPVTIKYCDVDVVSTDNYGISANYPGVTIEGVATGTANKISVCGFYYGISCGGGPINIKYCDVDVVSTNGTGIQANYPGVTLEGRADGSNDVTVRSKDNGILSGGSTITILNCDVEVTGLFNEETSDYDRCLSGLYASGNTGVVITGCDKGNSVVVRSNSSKTAGIYCDYGPIAIKNCSVDVVNDGGNGICNKTTSGKSGDIYIEGLANGTSKVTVRSKGNGIFADNEQPVTIKYCTVDIVNQNGNGIYATSGLTIEGIADGSNDVTVRSYGNGIYGPGGSVTITNCDVTATGLLDKVTGTYTPCAYNAIFEGGGSALTITGHTEKGNKVVTSSTQVAISGQGCTTNVSNCDMDVTSTSSDGIQGTDGLSLTSTLENGNVVKVNCKSNGLVSYGEGGLTIDNYTVDINSESYGIYNTSNKIDISNSDVTIESQRSSLYDVGSNGGTINNSRLKATTTGTKPEGGDYNTYDGIFVPYGITISGSQVDVSAQEGNWGINVAQDEYAATLGWTHATDYVNVSSYTGPVKVAEGQTLTDGSSLYSGELTEDEVTAIGGKKLQPGVGVTFAAAGYATYYDSDYDLVLPAGMQARVVTDEGAEKGTLKYETIADGDSEQNIVPAGTAVMLKVAAADEEQTLALTIGSGAEAYSGDNLLNGSDTDTEIPTATGSAFYKLTYGDDNTTFGWYWGGADGLSFTSAAHRAWLILPASVDARFLGLPEGEATGIAAYNAQEPLKADETWYTIGGMKLNGQPTAKGVYIKDGKKVVVGDKR